MPRRREKRWTFGPWRKKGDAKKMVGKIYADFLWIMMILIVCLENDGNIDNMDVFTLFSWNRMIMILIMVYNHCHGNLYLENDGFLLLDW